MKKNKFKFSKKSPTVEVGLDNNGIDANGQKPQESGFNNAGMPMFAKRGFEQAGFTAKNENEVLQETSPFDVEDADYSSSFDYEGDMNVFVGLNEIDEFNDLEDDEALTSLEDLDDNDLSSNIDIHAIAKNGSNGQVRVPSGKLIKIVAVKFKKNPKIYYFNPQNLEFQKSEGVVVDTERGVEYAVVHKKVFELDEALLSRPLKNVLRKADAHDIAQLENFNRVYPSIIVQANEMAKEHGLEMNVIDAEYTIDAQKLVLYFTAEGRVDFRELIKKLAGHFKARIELKQIGPRDEVRQKGALGTCGRVCCCASVMPDYPSVSIKMAKNQGISLNPQKISGQCGRLMCCLSYENAHYAELNRHLPKMGAKIRTKDGKEGTVVKLMHIKEKVRLKIIEKDAFIFSDYQANELVFKSKAEREAEEEINTNNKSNKKEKTKKNRK